ncbi:hypothetical protein THMIRHAM_17140 [Thiomicrorhabdus immobilis]|uniref:Type IV pilus biogenesis protein PilP n=1 Tax=Thiomicrorhabdus immobilis TaxID=2791037 RepID=A0ABM7MES9_9GAMM|nr:hypothetical protein [Thiomicrorhabdus immobilis]BCN93929.1 hypothetical protein THMIRHAM_17140 [Thiomicrorhabdus immobilis]
MKNIALTSMSLSFIMLVAQANWVFASEIAEKEANIEKLKVVNNQVSPHFKKLFLSTKDRLRIDKQREAYLNPPVAPQKEELVKLESKQADAIAKPKKKRIYIPPRVAISAVIVKPDGSTIIRVNNKYDQSPSKHINLDSTHANINGVPITVNGKTQIVPVGTTLLTHKNRTVDTYKLDAQARQRAMPKTEQKAVKERLEQVQILNADPTKK